MRHRTKLAVLSLWLGLATAGFAMPAVNCALNADQSALIVVASNAPDDFANEFTAKGTLDCQMSCLIKPAGQRLFSAYQCAFPLAADAPQQVVCTHQGSGPGAFTETRSQQLMCSPR